jgi:hypothetical protein
MSFIKKYGVFLSLFIVIQFFGCGIYQMQKVKNQYYPTWPKNIQSAVDKGQVVIGMNKLQVQIATGVGENLVQKRTYETQNETSETWTLWRFMGMWGYENAGGMAKMVVIYFKNGLVDSLSY